MSQHPTLNIYLNGDNCWPDLRNVKPEQVIHVAPDQLSLAFLGAGMQSGETSAMVRIDLPDGRTVLAETSLKLLALAVKAAAARYGMPPDDAAWFATP